MIPYRRRQMNAFGEFDDSQDHDDVLFWQEWYLAGYCLDAPPIIPSGSMHSLKGTKPYRPSFINR